MSGKGQGGKPPRGIRKLVSSSGGISAANYAAALPKKPVVFNPIVTSSTGNIASLRDSTLQRFGTGQVNFSTSTPYPADHTFDGVPRRELWSTPANRQRAIEDARMDPSWRPTGYRRNQGPALASAARATWRAQYPNAPISARNNCHVSRKYKKSKKARRTRKI